MSHQSSPMRDTINRNPESHSPFNSRYVPHLDVLLCHVYVRVCELLHAQIWGLINDINVSDGSRDTRNVGSNFQAPGINPRKLLVERNMRKDFFFFSFFNIFVIIAWWFFEVERTEGWKKGGNLCSTCAQPTSKTRKPSTGYPRPSLKNVQMEKLYNR